MSHGLILRAEAEVDVETAFRWYQRRSPGRGIYLLRAVREALAMIELNPTLYPIVYRDAPRVILRGFPYAIFYVVRDEVVEVAACIHNRRHPRRWRSRL